MSSRNRYKKKIIVFDLLCGASVRSCLTTYRFGAMVLPSDCATDQNRLTFSIDEPLVHSKLSTSIYIYVTYTIIESLNAFYQNIQTTIIKIQKSTDAFIVKIIQSCYVFTNCVLTTTNRIHLND